MELTGTIKKIFDTVVFDSGFKKREIVLTTDEQYPQHILIEFVAEKVDLLEKYQVGDKAKISINIRGREWTSPENVVKYFNSITGWRIEKLSDGSSESSNTNNISTSQTNTNDNLSVDITVKDDGEDDLPF